MKWLLCVVSMALAVQSCKSSSNALYLVEATTVEATVNSEVQAIVRIVPQKGYHWNEEFPAKARVTDVSGVSLKKTEFSSTDFVIERGEGRLPLTLVASVPGTSSIKLTVDFAICDDKGCIPFKNVPIELTVNAR